MTPTLAPERPAPLGRDERSPLLANQAYDRLRRDIVTCRLGPGQSITEEQIATRYGVGRAAVRAALKRLHQDRLVEVGPRQRYAVAAITLKHVADLYDVRLLLEPAAARQAAGRIDGDGLRHLNALCRTRYRVGDRSSAEAFLAANTEFHLAVAAATGNTVLVDLATTLLAKIERVHHVSHRFRDRNDDASQEHQELIDALVAGDAERASRVMTVQIEAARHFVLDAMLLSPSLQAVNIAPPHPVPAAAGRRSATPTDGHLRPVGVPDDGRRSGERS